MNYDRSRMQRDDDILTFQFGDYLAIEGNHFDLRKRQRKQIASTDIFGQKALSYQNAILRCFERLEQDQYDYILETVRANLPQNTEFIVAFETDEFARGGKSIYLFFVIAISQKETAFNDIPQGQMFLQLMTIVKDTCKRKVDKLNTVEVELAYNKLFNQYIWTDDVRFCLSRKH